MPLSKYLLDHSNETPRPLTSDYDRDTEGQRPIEELSREMRENLLDPEAWSPVLSTYARTTGLAVALTDCEGRQVGICHNPQPTWLAAYRARTENAEVPQSACSFCLDCSTPCLAVVAALTLGQVQLARDRTGLTHLAIPLSLAGNPLGAVIAGQIFDQYPEPLRLQRFARECNIPASLLWETARHQVPVRNATLLVFGELLFSLGNAFLQQRYAAILDRKLIRANLRLRLLLDGASNYALFTLDNRGKVTSWNLGAERVFGYSETEVIGQDFSRFFTPEDIQAGTPSELLLAADRDGSAAHRGWQVCKDGTRFFNEGSIAVLGRGGNREFGCLTHNDAEQRTSGEALRQAQKLESIGVLASGIAHDFNNLLSGILGGVSFALNTLPPGHPALAALSIASQSSEKAADLTHQLLAYAGQGKFVITVFDLSQLIRDMLKLLQTSIPRSVNLRLALQSDLPWIEADASQIQQVVMNLVINAAESIGPEGGTLWVSSGMADDVDVYIEVKDSGSGMTEETKARIFDPFFTTKFTGRGLGLAAVSGIVRGHGGRMTVESTLGEGSTFRICFPAVEKRAPQIETPAPKEREPVSGTVLVVDDEPALRMLAQMILEDCGYSVMVAEDGLQAVEIFRQHADTITAVLLDMTMPVMNGEEAFHLLRAIRADVPVVISTGYSEITTIEVFGADATVGFVQKPYTAARLCERVGATSRTAATLPQRGLY